MRLSMSVLVTGGAGYIGSHVCKALARQGYEPISCDDLSRGNAWAVKWGPLEKGDVLNEEQLTAALRRYRPRAVIHLAAYAYVGESCSQPLLYYHNNICGMTSLLRALSSSGPLPIVFSSSCAIYGNPQLLPIPEEHPQAPINPYGFSKMVAERLLLDVGNANQFCSVCLRFFNVAGADPEAEIGEAHSPETHLIPRVLAAALSGDLVEVYGADYDTDDGTCVRDYIHVMDVADAHILALDYLLQGSKSASFNLANRRGYSVREVIDTAREVSARPIRVAICPRRPGDPAALIGDASLVQKVLGWKPVRSALPIQIADAWRWMCAGRNR
jgi:UDP-glucose-4-epimerase GalE